MSAQTIQHKSLCTLKDKFTDILLKNVNDLMLFERFGLGESNCAYQQRDAVYMLKILNIGSCSLEKLILKQIEKNEL